MWRSKGQSWKGRLARAGLWCCCLSLPAPILQASEPAGWEEKLLRELYLKYLGVPASPETAQARAQLDQLSSEIGQRLTRLGVEGVPAQDLALLALLQARTEKAPVEEKPEIIAGEVGSPSAMKTASPLSESPPGERPQDITKGDEGIRQGLERLAELPLSERLVITGDVTAGLQAATVPGSPELTTTFGRTRVNAVVRALPASSDGLWDEGHFFVQMIAAGGAPDSAPVGGPVSFTAFNDVATDRSRFNEPVARGNIYLNKAFYQQGVRLFGDRFTARAGILDLTDFFDNNALANNEVRQFLNSSLVNSAGYKTGLIVPGVMGEYSRRLQNGALEGIVVRASYAVSTTERAFTSPLWTGEVELQTLWRGRRGAWRFGGAIGNVPGAGSVRNFYTSMDHWLGPRLGVFGRYAVASAGLGSLTFGPVRHSYSGGVQWLFVDSENRVSAFAVGFSQAFGLATEFPLASERVLETYYRWQLARNFSLSPDFQLVLGSGGKRSRGTQAIFGLRMFVGF